MVRARLNWEGAEVEGFMTAEVIVEGGGGAVLSMES